MNNKVNNTKIALKKLITAMDRDSDAFVDLLVKEYPDKFIDSGKSDECLDPFVLIGIHLQLLNESFNQFKKELPKDNIVSFNNKKGDNIH